MKHILAIFLTFVSAQAAVVETQIATNGYRGAFYGVRDGTRDCFVMLAPTKDHYNAVIIDGTSTYTIGLDVGGFSLLGSPVGVELSGTNLFVSVAGVPPRVLTFALTGAPLSTATCIETNTLPSSDWRIGPVCKTSGGGVFAFSYAFTPGPAPYNMTNGISYRDTSGTWTNVYTNYFVGNGGGFTSCQMTAARHPADDSVWCFYKRDAYSELEACRVVETGGAFTNEMLTAFLSSAIDGEDSIEGELGWPVALEDSTANKIKLCYTRDHWQIFTNTPFTKGAYWDICNIAADKSKTFTRYDDWMEREERFGVLLDSGDVNLFYHKISIAGVTTNFYRTVYSGGSWSTPTVWNTSTYTNSVASVRGGTGMSYSKNLTTDKTLWFVAPATTGPSTIDSGSGLAISLDASGAVTGVTLSGGSPPVVGTGGFFAKDFAGATPYVAATSTVTPIAGGVSLAGSVSGLSLDLAATLVASGGNIAVAGSITNTAGGDRAIGLRFSLPVDLSGWAWWDDAVATRSIAGTTNYTNATACGFGIGKRSVYPLAVTSTAGRALALAVPIDIPQPFLLSYDNSARQLNFDAYLGLAAGATKYVKSGEFNFILYNGTNGGFREALAHYYATYPTPFTKRQPWEAPYNYGSNEIFNRSTHRLDVFPLSYTNMSDFGEGLDFITSLHGVSYDATWATNSPVRPSDALLRSWLSVQPAGSQYPGSDAELQLATDSSGAVRYITSVYTPSVPQWFFELMVNQDPEIASGLTTKINGLLAAYYATAHPAWGSTITSDFAEGGAGSVNLDFYPAHLAVADLTPTFDSVTFAPAMFSQLWDFYDDYLAPAVAARSFLVMGNAGAPDDLYTAPYIDIGMSEGYRTAAEYRFYRMLSYHKSWRNWRTTDNTQPYTQSIFQSELDACLAQGIYPSLGVLSVDGVLEAFRPYYRTYIPAIEELSSAGWEPFTHATASTGAIPERFGSFAADTLCFSVANPTSSTISTTVTMDTAALGASPASWTCIDLISLGNVTVSGGTFTITLTPGQTQAFWIGDSAHEWHRAAILAQMYIDRLSRSFAPDLSAGDLARIAALTASLAAVNSNASLAAARPTLNSEVDAIVSNMVTAGTGDLNNLATHIKSLLGLSGSFTPASVSAFIIQVRSGI